MATNPYKKGDKVICVSMDPSYNDKLTIGNTYTVKAYDDDDEDDDATEWVNIGTNCYHYSHFKPVSKIRRKNHS